MRDDMISCLIQLVQETSNLHAYTVQQLYRAMSADISQQPLLQVAAWCIGEFGDQLFMSTSDDDEPVQVCFCIVIIIVRTFVRHITNSVATRHSKFSRKYVASVTDRTEDRSSEGRISPPRI